MSAHRASGFHTSRAGVRSRETGARSQTALVALACRAVTRRSYRRQAVHPGACMPALVAPERIIHRGGSCMLLQVYQWTELEQQPSAQAKSVEPIMDRQVFFSYRWTDQEFVQEFYRELTTYNVRVWMDIHQLQLGDGLTRSINEAVLETDCFVLCLSRTGYRSLKEGAGGFNIEVEAISQVRRARKIQGRDTRIVIVDLEDFADIDLIELPLLQNIADSLRLRVKDAFSAFSKSGDTTLLRVAVREFVAKAIAGELRLFPRVQKIHESLRGYLLSWVGAGAEDSVRTIVSTDKWDERPRALIPLSDSTGIPVLHIEFSHGTGDTHSLSPLCLPADVRCCSQTIFGRSLRSHCVCSIAAELGR